MDLKTVNYYKSTEKFKNDEFKDIVYNFVNEMNFIFSFCKFKGNIYKLKPKWWFTSYKERLYKYTFYLTHVSEYNTQRYKVQQSLYKRCVSLLQMEFSDGKIRKLIGNKKQSLVPLTKEIKELKKSTIETYIKYKLEIWKLHFIKYFNMETFVAYFEFYKAIINIENNFNKSFTKSNILDYRCIIKEVYKFIK